MMPLPAPPSTDLAVFLLLLGAGLLLIICGLTVLFESWARR
jgi:hypothetical protein